MATTKKLDADDEISPSDLTERYGEFRKLLLHRKTTVLKQTEAERMGLGEQIMTSPGDVGDASVVDTSVDYFLALADNDRRELVEINDAFERMRKGVFGLCESCESPIAIERLRRLPHARRCIDCQTTLERKYRTTRASSTPKL